MTHRHETIAASFATLLVLTGCGGPSGSERQDEDLTLPVEDYGGGPYRCEVDEDVEFRTLFDFERGAVDSVYYFNDNSLGAEVTPDIDGNPYWARKLYECQQTVPQGDPDGECRAIYEKSIEGRVDSSELADTIPGGRCGSTFALHVQFEGFYSWGGTLSIGLGNDRSKPACQEHLAELGMGGASGAEEPGYDPCLGIDASDWDGIAMWVRRGPQSSPSVRFIIDEASTKFPAGGGTCEPDHELRRCEGFGTTVPLSTTWELVYLPFDEMMQGGQRVHYIQEGPDLTTLSGIVFKHGTEDMDLWVDDVALYRER